MVRKESLIISLGALLIGLQGCSLFRDKEPEYLQSVDGAPLQVPEDLDEIRYERPIAIRIDAMRLPAGDELNPGPPRAVSTGGRGDTNAFMAWSADGVYLMVKDTPDSVARRLRFAIQRSGMSLTQSGEAGDHEFEYVHIRIDERGFFEKMLFWRSDAGPNHSGVYRTRLEQDGDHTRVYLLSNAGRPADTSSAEHILGIFMERLG